MLKDVFWAWEIVFTIVLCAVVIVEIFTGVFMHGAILGIAMINYFQIQNIKEDVEWLKKKRK